MIYSIFILPVLIIFIGIWMLKYPPRKINWFIGYRTRRSMENEKVWKFANQYCGKLLIKLGTIMLFINILLLVLLYFKLLNLTEIFISIVMLFQVAIIILPIFIIENKIKNRKL